MLPGGAGRGAVAERTLRELDLDGDGGIDDADWKLASAIKEAALGLDGKDQGVAQRGWPPARVYAGPTKNQAGVVSGDAVFGFVRWHGGRVDLEKLPPHRVRELAVEAGWLAGQVRLAAAFGLRPVVTPVAGALREMFPGYSDGVMTPRAVCAGMRRFDTTPYVRAGLRPAAVFDLDSTIWAGNVTDAFLAMLIERGLLREEANPPLRAFLRTIEGINREEVDANDTTANARILLGLITVPNVSGARAPVSAKDAFFTIVRLLRGLDEQAVSEAAHAVFAEGVAPWGPWKQRIAAAPGCSMAEIVSILQQRGIDVYLLSATLDVLAVAGADVLNVPRQRVLGSILERHGGVYTGNVTLNTYEIKAPIVRDWVGMPPLFAFGDSPTSDFPLLAETMGVAFMVNPRSRLLQRDEEEAGSRMTAVTFPTTIGERQRPGERN